MGYFDRAIEERDDHLAHHGIRGQKWGVRRFEKAGGGLTAAGKARYQTDANGDYKKIGKSGGGASSIVSTQKNPKVENFVKKNGINGNLETKNPKGAISLKSKKQGGNKAERVINNESNGKVKVKSDLVKKLAIAGGVTVAAGLTAYGLHKLNQKATEGIRQLNNSNASEAFSLSNRNRVNAATQRRDAKRIKDYGEDYSVLDFKRLSAGAERSQKLADDWLMKAMTYSNKAKQKNYSLKEKVNYLRGK